MLATHEIDRRQTSRRQEARIFAFGRFRLDVAQRQLITSDRVVIDLPSRAFDLLLYLVERPGQLIDKSTLLKGIWPTTVVEENNLSQCIFALRRALRDTAQEHRFIVTVPGRGYQFVAKVHTEAARAEVSSPEPAPVTSSRPVERRAPWISSGIIAMVLIGLFVWRSSSHTGASGSRTHSIVVLPFADFSAGHDMKYFTDGMVEELTDSLTRVGSLRVVGRRSAAAFKDANDDARSIGAKLNVDIVLEGSVRKNGERIRISARLVRTRDGISLWSETYDLAFDDAFDIQNRVAGEVAAALRPKIDPVTDARTS